MDAYIVSQAFGSAKIRDLWYVILLLKTYCRNCPFFVVEIFSDGTRYPKICYSNIVPIQTIFCIEILLFGRWLMAVPSIDHGNDVPDTRVGELF